MSSFNNYFERENFDEIKFESDSFYPFLETIIILLIIYFSYKLYNSIKSPDSKFQNSEKYINCQCDNCKKRFKKIMKKNHKNKHTKILVMVLLFLFYFAKKYYAIILQNKSKINAFDPYEILQISSSSDNKEIKKAYKRLALLYHPDKNKDDINAKNKFMLINKAYETLTNEEFKKNYEIYGNPDGLSPMRMSLGIPYIILNKNNHFFILVILLIIICIIIPYYFIKWHIKISNFDENGLFYKTNDYFKKSTNINSILLAVPFILGNSEEFNLIPEPHIMSEINHVNYLYDKYKNVFKNKGILERIGFTISLNKKKAIGIAYEYSFCDRTDKNYLKLHKLNEYIILLSKLLNSFIDSQIEKYFQLKILKKMKEMKNKENIIFKESLEWQPIKLDFIFSLILYQQCFYQGLPIYSIKDKYIPYIQLPHISLNNYKNLKEKDVDFLLEQFLNYSDEGKKTIMKKVFNFNDMEITDIIESTKSIPRYNYKVSHYVEGFEDKEICKGDKVTIKLNITRENEEDKKMGVQHSKCFPGLFREFSYIMVINNDNLIKQEKFFFNKKENEYKFTINISSVGILNIKIILIPATFFTRNIVINCQLKCQEKSEKREERFKNLENINKIEKIKPPFIKKYFFNFQEDDDDDEDDEDDDEEEEEKVTKGKKN